MTDEPTGTDDQTLGERLRAALVLVEAPHPALIGWWPERGAGEPGG